MNPQITSQMYQNFQQRCSYKYVNYSYGQLNYNPLPMENTIGINALKNTTKAKKYSNRPRKVPQALQSTLSSEDVDTSLNIKIEENSNSPQMQSSNTVLIQPRQNESRMQVQENKIAQQSKVKNANKYYFKKIMKYFKEYIPQNQYCIVQKVIQNIKSSAVKENYTLKHFRVISLVITEQNKGKLQKADLLTQNAVFAGISDDQEEINKFKKFYTEQVLQFLEHSKLIKNDIISDHKDPETIERYLGWGTNISINLRKMLSGEYVSRF